MYCGSPTFLPDVERGQLLLDLLHVGRGLSTKRDETDEAGAVWEFNHGVLLHVPVQGLRQLMLCAACDRHSKGHGLSARVPARVGAEHSIAFATQHEVYNRAHQATKHSGSLERC